MQTREGTNTEASLLITPLAGPFQTKAAACAWIEMQTTIGQAAAIP